MASKTRKTRRSKLDNFSRYARIYLLVAIPVVFVVLVASIIYANLSQPERIAKDKINALIKYYYEDVVYKGIIESDDYSSNPSDYLAKYQKPGLPRMTLRQMALRSDVASDDALKLTLDYCDKDSTAFIVYPDEPYSRTDYHAKITYTCNF